MQAFAHGEGAERQPKVPQGKHPVEGAQLGCLHGTMTPTRLTSRHRHAPGLALKDWQ